MNCFAWADWINAKFRLTFKLCLCFFFLIVDCNYTHWGLTYIGSINITQEGLTCQRWDSKWPHAMISNITDANFPDGSKSAAQNFCRNPFPKDRNKNFSYTPWCYTTDPNVSWQYCNPYRDDNGSEGSTAYSGICMIQSSGG